MNNAVQATFDSWPGQATEQLMTIRALIFEVAREDDLGDIGESLKWGEPSYTSDMGSPVRIAWKAGNPEVISVYFNCNTLLVETFRVLHQDTFQFEGNREIRLPLSEVIPSAALKQCLSLALRYHRIKHLPSLGT